MLRHACGVALANKGTTQSEAQIVVMHHLVQAGHGYLCSSDYRDVVETLKGWGALQSGIHVQ